MKQLLLLLTIMITLTFSSCTKEELNNNDTVFATGALVDNTTISNLVDLPTGGSTPLPSFKDLSHLMPPIRSQESQFSCVGFALSYLKSYHERLEYGYSYTDNTKIMSPAFIYNQVKLPGDCDKTGCSTINGLNLLMNSGVSTESEFSFNELDCTKLPNSQIKSNALKNKIKDWKGFDFQNKKDNAILYEMKYYINEMQPIVIDIHLDNNFYKLGFNNSDEVTWKFNLSQSNGYHTLLIVGYDDNKNAFKVWNSWDTEWGNNGWIWIDYNMFFRNVQKAFVTWDVIGGPQSQGTGGGPQSGGGGGGGTDPCTSFKVIQYQGSTNIGFVDDDVLLMQGEGGTAPYSFYIDGVFHSSNSSQAKFAVAVPHKANHTYTLVIRDSKGCEISKKR